MKKIFISQKVLDALFSEGKADLDGNRLTIHSRMNQVFILTQAFKFLAVADGSPDASGFTGKIFTQSELKKIKADIYMDSAIVNDVPYQVEPSFIGLPEVAGEGAAASPAAEPVAAPPATPEPASTGPSTAGGAEAGKEQGQTVEEADNEMLTDYLLKIL